MKYRLFVVSALLSLSLAEGRAECKDGHFWLSLSGKNIPFGQVGQQIPSWLSLPPGTTFEQTKDYTDHLGVRHQEFQQYVGGVKVMSGILRVHGRGDTLSSANGYVLEDSKMPSLLARSAHGASIQKGSQPVVLVCLADGSSHYACQGIDFLTGDELYTDSDSGEVLVRLPRTRQIDATTITRPSIFGGDCTMTVAPLADGDYSLADEERKIYTLDSRPLPMGGPTDGNMKSYILDNCKPMVIDKSESRILRVDSVVMDKPDEEMEYCDWGLLYYDSKGQLYGAGTLEYDWNLGGVLPYTYNLRGYYIDCSHPYEMEFVSGKVHSQAFSLHPAAPGVYPLEAKNADGQVCVRGKYHIGYAQNFVYDVHWGMEKTYDFYKNTLLRDSYDNQGAPIYNLVYTHLAKMDNASAVFTDRSFPFMVYGMGKSFSYPLVSIDVIAHEFTHMVTDRTSNLIYEGESGALNEAFSDIVGITVKQKAKNLPHNWQLLDDCYDKKDCLRDMANPTSKRQPAIYKGEYWDNLSWTCVHTNSGVGNHWYYLLSEGGDSRLPDGKEVHVDGIGTDKAIQIAYRTFTEVLTSKSNYPDAMKGALVAAADLYGEGSPEYKSTRNAWAAVGVGEPDPSSGIASVATDASRSRQMIYTLSGLPTGRTTLQTLSPGIYIQNGKKIVKK